MGTDERGSYVLAYVLSFLTALRRSKSDGGRLNFLNSARRLVICQVVVSQKSV